MKLSVSIPDEDVRVLDEYVARRPGASRSGALHVAIELLRERSLVEQYDVAMDEWTASGEAGTWDATAGDGIGGSHSDAS